MKLSTLLLGTVPMKTIDDSTTAISSTTNTADNSTTLVPLVFDPLPLGSVKPAGWLLDQLQLQGNGLAGHLHDFYDYVAHEKWLGGTEQYSELLEGTPYWYNGIVPLAYHLNDQRLKDQVHSATQYVLDHQQSDGWIGPETGTARNFWARHMFFLGMIQLAEANSTWEQPILDAFGKFMPLMHTMLANNYTGYLYHTGDEMQEGDTPWGRVRSQDLTITLQWLYEKHPGNMSDILMDNMKSLHDAGLNWEDWYNEPAYFGRGFDKALGTLPDSLTGGDLYAYEHGVNVGQGLKAPAVIRRFTHNDSLIQTAHDGVNWTMSYHGAASGTVLADERLEGLMPYSGSELCTAVETMYSLAYLYQALGDKYYAELTEVTAFNALPAMLTPDWWGRQYVAQPNQPYAKNLSDSDIFYNTNSFSQTFGLEPDYPCCTVNHGQGFPKFTSSLFVTSGTNGLAHALLAPGSVSTQLSSGKVSVTCDTGYPFLDTLTYNVTSDGAFDFYVRVPSWAASQSNIAVGNGAASALSPDPTSGLHKVSLPAGTTTVTYNLSASVETKPRANETIAVFRGSLLYALEIGNTNTSTAPKLWNDTSAFHAAGYAPSQSMDWEYFNTTEWNIAIDPSTLSYVAPSNTNPTGLANPIFAPDAPPAHITAKGCTIDWPLYLGSTPGYAPTGDAKKCLGDSFDVKLIPYAAAKLRMAEIPTIDLTQ